MKLRDLSLSSLCGNYSTFNITSVVVS